MKQQVTFQTQVLVKIPAIFFSQTKSEARKKKKSPVASPDVVKWFFTILRIKTIYLEMREKRGLVNNRSKQELEEAALKRIQLQVEEAQKPSQETSDDYHSKNYIAQMCGGELDPKLVADTAARIKAEFWIQQEKNNARKWQPNDYSENDVQFPEKLDELFSHSLITKTIQLELCEFLDCSKDAVRWPDIRVTRKYYRYVLKCRKKPNNDQIIFMHRMRLLTEGKLDYLSDICINEETYIRFGYRQPRLIAFQYWFKSTVLLSMLIVQPRRVAIFQSELDRTVIGHAYYQYIEFCEHFTNPRRDNNDRQQLPQTFTQQFMARYRDNPNTHECFLPVNAFRNLPFEHRGRAAFDINNVFTFEPAMRSYQSIWAPVNFIDIPVDPQLVGLFEFNAKLNEWECKTEFEFLAKKFDCFQKANSQIMKTVASEDGAALLLKLIKSVPNLKFKLTPEQELMISTPHNLLCLGRSGTGKTTSSALRLFATEAFYKYHDARSQFKLENPQASLREFKVPVDFIKKPSTVKLLFVSASPVLTNEVKRFCVDFKDHFTRELKRSREKDKEVPAVKSDQPSNFSTYIELEIKALEEEEVFDSQVSLAHSLDRLKNEDFPLFLTVKRLLYMIDASTALPFFPRDANGNQIGMDTNVQWHNESGGVLMINQYHKSGAAIDAQIEELGLKMIEYTERLESGKELPDLQAQQREEAPFKGSGKEQSGFGLGELVCDQEFSYQGSMVSQGQKLSFEVDYEMFRTKFWPKVTFKTQISPLVAWTEICSEIKGRYDSWQHPYGGLPDNMYVKMNRTKNHFLEPEERYQIYRIFLMYEKWKQELGAYDLNDLVNHILRQVKADMIRASQRVHFLMVDEVQDLTQNIISLFMMLAEKNVFFSGDTAQTIAKGVGFRFFDLKTVFSKQQTQQTVIEVPKVLQLAKNFRSHARILDLANSVVSLLELIFPRTIDKLVKESSDSNGPKPIIIEEVKDFKLLSALLDKLIIFGSKRDASFQNKEGQQFGATQVVIVRNQESKADIPEFMKDMLCLTVYEAKGLEFDDVILYNFFRDSPCGPQWKLLNEVSVHQTRIKKILRDALAQFEMLECGEPALVQDENQINTQSVQDDGDTEVTTVLKLNSDKNFIDSVHRKFSQVCTELKLLYVAITRPKNFLVIYDQDSSQRRPLQDYWVKQNVVDVVDKKMSQNQDYLPSELQDSLRLINNPESAAKSNSAQQDIINKTWQLQGLKLFRVKYYRAAAQCFNKIGASALVQRCLAYETADRAVTLRSQHDQKMAQVQDRRAFITKAEAKTLKKEANEILQDFKKQMTRAGELFAEIQMIQHAAQCFYSAGSLANSAELFIKQGNPGPAAECFYKLGQIKRAAQLYSDARLFTNAIQCYEQLEDWDGLIQCLYKFKDEYGAQDRNALLEKYFPIALNSTYQLYQQMIDPSAADQGFLTEENKGKIQQMRVKLKFQRSVSVIKEDEELEESVESSSDDNEETEVIANVPTKAQQIVMLDEQREEQPSAIDDEHSFQIVDDTLDGDQKQPLQEPFNRNLELELLSNIDPEDEFLNSTKSFQIIESVSLNDSSYHIVDDSSQSYSDYSIISGSAIHSAVQSLHSFRDACAESNNKDGEGASFTASSLSRYSVIDAQKRDDFADDIVLQKVIYYISMFQTEVKQHIRQVSSDPLSQAMADQVQNSDELVDNLDFMLIDLDDLSPDVISLVLATLQHYEMYRMCIMLCSRFKLSERIGQFVSAISEKYSNLKQFRITITDKFAKAADRQSQLRYSVLAHEAVQNVLNFSGQVGSSQIQVWLDKSFTNLFLQGYWKKLVYTTSFETSIQLSWVMSDFEALKVQYLVQKVGISDPAQMEKLIQHPVDFSKLVTKNRILDAKLYSLIKNVNDEEHSQSVLDQLLALASKSKNYCCKQLDSCFEHLVERQEHCPDCGNQPPDTPWIKQVNGRSFLSHLKNERKIHVQRSAMLVCKVVAQSTTAQVGERTPQQRFNQLRFSLRNDLLLHALTYLRQGLNGDADLLRAVFRAHGASLLDNLDIFARLSSNYCVVSAQSVLFNELMKYHELSLLVFKIETLKRYLVDQYVSTGSTEDFYAVFFKVKQKVLNEFIKMSAKEQLNYEFALVCSLNLDHYLVPKPWVLQCLVRHMTSQVFARNASTAYSETEKVVLLLAQQICTNVCKGAEDPYLEIQQRFTEALKFAGYFFTENQFKLVFKQIFNIQLPDNRAPLPSAPKNLANILKTLDREIQKAFVAPLWNNAQIQLKPTHAAVVQPSGTFLGRHLLEMCLVDFNQLRAVRPQYQPDYVYKLFKKFTTADAIVQLKEMRQNSNHTAAIEMFDQLIAAHLQARSNNLNEAANLMLKWLSKVFDKLSFTYFYEIVEEAFAKAWFSYKIYASQDGAVILTPHQADLVSTKLRMGDFQVLQQLQDVRVANGNLKTVKLALIWVECFLNNLGLYEGWQEHERKFELGLRVVRTVLIAKPSNEELQVLQKPLVQIIEAVSKRVQVPKVEKDIFSKASSAHIKESSSGQASYLNKCLGQPITFSLVDRKKVASIVNQIELDVTNCHSNVLGYYQELMEKRAKAAKTITTLFYPKLGKRTKQSPVDALCRSRLISKSGQKHMPEALAAYLRDSFELQRRCVHFVCTNISTDAVSREQALRLLERLSQATEEAFARSFVPLGAHNTLHSERIQFDAWLSELSGDKVVEQQSIEAERRRFMKREKWDTVIQFHQKKKIMLKHFKSTLAKQKKLQLLGEKA